MFQALFIVFTFPGSYIIDNYGIRTGVLVGIVFNTTGMIIKIFINRGFWICILGQVLCAIAQPFFVNVPAKLAQTWFGSNERLTALTISVAAIAIGAAIGFVFPTFFIADSDKDDLFRHNVMLCLIAQAIIGGVLSIVTLLFFKNRPKHPPNPTAFERIDEAGVFWSSLKDIFGNKDFMFLFFCFLNIQGGFNTLATIVAYICEVYDYSDSDASLFGGTFIVGGVIGTAFFGILVEKTRRYKQAIVVICFFSGVFTLCLYFFMKLKIVWLTTLICFFQGFMMVAIMGVSFDLAVELTFPVGESISSGIMMSAG